MDTEQAALALHIAKKQKVLAEEAVEAFRRAVRAEEERNAEEEDTAEEAVAAVAEADQAEAAESHSKGQTSSWHATAVGNGTLGTHLKMHATNTTSLQSGQNWMLLKECRQLQTLGRRRGRNRRIINCQSTS
eukprot:1961090-Rhodomonas_salina.1